MRKKNYVGLLVSLVAFSMPFISAPVFSSEIVVVPFEEGKSKLTAPGYESLNAVQAELNTLFMEHETLTLTSCTRAHGTPEYNLALSDMRANSVITYLEALGFGVDDIDVYPMGETCYSANDDSLFDFVRIDSVERPSEP